MLISTLQHLLEMGKGSRDLEFGIFLPRFENPVYLLEQHYGFL